MLKKSSELQRGVVKKTTIQAASNISRYGALKEQYCITRRIRHRWGHNPPNTCIMLTRTKTRYHTNHTKSTQWHSEETQPSRNTTGALDTSRLSGCNRDDCSSISTSKLSTFKNAYIKFTRDEWLSSLSQMRW